MINEERLRGVQLCFISEEAGGFLKDDTSDADRLKHAVSVILRAVDDCPAEIQPSATFPESSKKVTERLTEREATLIAQSVRWNLELEARVQQLTDEVGDLELSIANRWKRPDGTPVPTCDFSHMLEGFQQHHDEDMDEVENCKWLSDAMGVPIQIADAFLEHIRWLEGVGAANEAAMSERERAVAKQMLEEAKEASDRAVSNAWSAGEIERQKARAWRIRTERLRSTLLVLAESPRLCENCRAKLLAPMPHTDDVLKGFGSPKQG